MNKIRKVKFRVSLCVPDIYVRIFVNLFKPEFYVFIIKNSSPVSQRIHRLAIMKPGQLMLLAEQSLFIVINIRNFYEYNEFHRINGDSGRNAKFFNTETVVYEVTI